MALTATVIFITTPELKERVRAGKKKLWWRI